MKLLTFDERGRTSWGVLTERGVVEPSRRDPTLPSSIMDLIAIGPSVFDRVAAITAGAEATAQLRNVTLLTPIARPGKIMCIGRNYADHVAETAALGLPRTERPSLFMKASSNVVGPSAPLRAPVTSSQLDYEVELGVVIGRRGVLIPKNEALDYVAGYTIVNDLSIRDIQFDPLNGGNVVGKNFDGSAPIGPWIVTADEIGDPNAVRVRTYVNGELRQDASCADMIFTVADIIEFLSQQMTLEPGDVISTGTPAGSGFGMDPPRWLSPGDVVRLEIDGVGYLQNPVVD
jgi:2-keto-4-pentenoate hydratase/2-oxohepta-3-ene-1,7-dioic acid hydratase in catechol pathway